MLMLELISNMHTSAFLTWISLFINFVSLLNHDIIAGEAASAIDLAELFVEALEKSKTPVSSAVLDRFDEVDLYAYFYPL